MADFLTRAKKVHGDTFDYSKVVYRTARDAVTIICPVHGEFEQIAHSHLQGRGCARCSSKDLAEFRSRKIAEEYLNKVRAIHGNHYDLSEVVYIAAKKMVTPICSIHGMFEIRADVLESGAHCQKCSYIKRGKDKADSLDDFVSKAISIHGDKYTYSEQTYINAFTSVQITCPTHGNFLQIPNSHLRGNGCPKCVHHVSVGEQEVADFVTSIDPTAKTSVRSLIPPKEIDIYSSRHNLGFEYCGVYWHAENNGGKSKFYHRDKMQQCKNINIQLLTVFEDEWLFHSDKIKSKIRQMLGGTQTKIPAKSCKVIELTTEQAKNFLNQHHLQGSTGSNIRLGLEYESELVCVMTFTKTRFSKSYQWEIARLCSSLDTIVVGGASKLFKAFVNEYNPKSVVTYADLRYGEGNVYKHLEFTFSHNSNPNYWYVYKGAKVRESRIKYQKHKLVQEGYDPKLSEWQIMQSRGYDRIWDCGNAVWVYKNPNIT